MKREPSGCALTFAVFAGYVFALWVWSRRLPYDSDNESAVTFLAVWGLSAFVLASLPSVWEAVSETVRGFRKR